MALLTRLKGADKTAIRRRRRVSPLAAALLLGVASMGTAGGARADEPAVEYAVKAAYLYKFAPFVAWPPAAFASRSSPFYICILGADPFSAAINQSLGAQTLDGHPVMVRRFDRVEGTEACHILYLAGASKQLAGEALRHLRGAPVLTVADQAAGREGSVIQFVVKDGRVRFNIDVAAAASSQMAISSKLLSLALTVYRSHG